MMVMMMTCSLCCDRPGSLSWCSGSVVAINEQVYTLRDIWLHSLLLSLSLSPLLYNAQWARRWILVIFGFYFTDTRHLVCQACRQFYRRTLWMFRLSCCDKWAGNNIWHHQPFIARSSLLSLVWERESPFPAGQCHAAQALPAASDWSRLITWPEYWPLIG